MQTQTISDEHWIEYFNRFSRDHMGWTATIEVLDRKSGPQHIAVNLPFQGISFDTKGTRPCMIEVNLGDRPGRHISHMVDLPLHIRQADEADGSIDVQIEPADGPTTLLHLRGPVH